MARKIDTVGHLLSVEINQFNGKGSGRYEYFDSNGSGPHTAYDLEIKLEAPREILRQLSQLLTGAVENGVFEEDRNTPSGKATFTESCLPLELQRIVLWIARTYDCTVRYMTFSDYREIWISLDYAKTRQPIQDMGKFTTALVRKMRKWATKDLPSA